MIIGIDASRAAIPRRTGTEAYAYYLIRNLLPLAHICGHTVKLYYNHPPVQPISDAPHQPINIPFPRLWTHVRLAAELHRRPPDVFFTPAHVIPLSYRGKSVATVHDLGYRYFPEAHTPSQVLQLRWSTRHNAKRSHVVLADSQATKHDLKRFDAISAEKIAVVYPAYDAQLKPVADPLLLQSVQQKLSIQPPYFLFLSTLQPRKNVARIVEAFAQIADDIPHQLVLAGKPGWRADSIMATIAQQPPAVQARIRLPGYVADEDKAALLSAATALVYPSLYEGFGFPVLEAQACGTAVVTATNSSLPEVASDAALLVSADSTVQLAQAMHQLATNSDQRAALVAKGFDNLKRFSWERTARQTLDIMERVHHA